MLKDRRRFLGALALAPAALAGCGGARGASTGAARAARDAPAAPTGAAAEAVRAFPLEEGEPAVIFRAAAARPGGA